MSLSQTSLQAPTRTSIDVLDCDYQFLRKYIYDHSGIIVERGKQYFLQSRLQPVAERLGFTTIAALCQLLWSTAASSGRESHSIAILLRELGMSKWSIDPFGTDISHQIFQRARQGAYLSLQLGQRLPASLRSRYFTESLMGISDFFTQEMQSDSVVHKAA
jgi:chemotaxis methyl-accepting protein methylase